jgi:vitamin B12 transporter
MKQALLILLYPFFTIVAVAQNSDKDTTIIELADVIITENRLETPFSESARSMYVITKAQLSTLPVQSVAEALTYVPGVDIRQRGPMGIQADIGIRGGTFDQTLILINGVKVSDPQTGHHSFNLPLSMDNVERIEVLKGQGARIYGQNAFNGAINIITKVPEKKAVFLRGYGGDFGTFGGNVSLALPGKTYGQNISVGYDRSDGYHENDDYKLGNVFYQSYLNALGGSFNLIGGFTGRKFGAAGFYVPDSEEYEEVKTGFVSIDYTKKHNNLTFKPRVYWRRNHDDYVFIRSDPDYYHNLHTTNVYGAETNMTYRNTLGLTGVGVEIRSENINSTNLGEHERTIAGIFAEHRFYFFNKLDVTPGIYINWYSDYGWNYFPGLDMSYDISQSLKLFTNLGRSFRIPTFTDLYYQGPSNIGNSNLEPESAFTYEGGIKLFQKGFWGQVSYFKRNASNLIDWVREDNEQPWQPQNFYNVDIQGVEATLEFNFNNLIAGSFPLQKFTANYTYIEAALLNTPAESRYALDNLKHQLILGANSRIYKNLFLDLRFRFLDRVTLDNYNLLDTRLYYKRENLNIFAEATNLTNTSYKEAGYVQMPGRWLRAGLQLTLNLEKN